MTESASYNPTADSLRLINRAGFTLIEISIALVIIGLLVGGVVVGRHLIEVAQIRSYVNQLQSYDIAMKLFKNKYMALPGDITNPQSFGLASGGCGVGRGNGNGLLNTSGGWNNDMEQSIMWKHLSEAGLIEFTSILSSYECISSTPAYSQIGRLPIPKIGPSVGSIKAVPVQSRNWWMIGDMTDTNNTTRPTITRLQASMVDQMIDDGVASTGKVQSGNDWWQITPNYTNGTNPPMFSGCASAAGVYDLSTSSTANGLGCLMFVSGDY